MHLELLDLVVREAPAVPVNAMIRADPVDLMASCLVQVFQAESEWGRRLLTAPSRELAKTPSGLTPLCFL